MKPGSMIFLMVIFVFHDITRAALIGREPYVGACLCLTSTSDIVTSRHACERGNIRLSGSGCYTYTGARASCDSSANDVFNDDEVFFRLQLKSNESVWVHGRHLSLEHPSRCLTGDTTDDDCPRIVSRAEWHARPPKSVKQIKEPIPKIFIHHTDTGSCTTQQDCSSIVRSIQNFHMDTRGWDDIGYNFLVGEDGNAYEGRGWDRVGAQVKYYNEVSLGFSMIGTFDTKLPNDAALNTVKKLIACSLQKGKSATSYTLHGHRDGGCTDCPGQKLYELINTWPHYGGKLPHHCD